MATTTHKTIADVLLTAADLIERDGWWNGVGPRPDVSPRCAVMALDAASKTDVVLEHVEAIFAQYIGAPHRITTWNDSQSNGAAVIAALRACARSL